MLTSSVWKISGSPLSSALIVCSTTIQSPLKASCMSRWLGTRDPEWTEEVSDIFEKHTLFQRRLLNETIGYVNKAWHLHYFYSCTALLKTCCGRKGSEWSQQVNADCLSVMQFCVSVGGSGGYVPLNVPGLSSSVSPTAGLSFLTPPSSPVTLEMSVCGKKKLQLQRKKNGEKTI